MCENDVVTNAIKKSDIALNFDLWKLTSTAQSNCHLLESGDGHWSVQEQKHLGHNQELKYTMVRSWSTFVSVCQQGTVKSLK